MCENLTVRRAIKQGSGIPTIPVSTSHQNGDWLTTDIYVGEQYLDTDTGIVYTRNGNDIEIVGGGAGNKKVWKGLVSQTGTNAPTNIQFENTTADGEIVFGYTGVGSYGVELTGVFTANKVFLTIENANVNGVIMAQRVDVNFYNILTFDFTFTPSNDVLENTSISFEIYP